MTWAFGHICQGEKVGEVVKVTSRDRSACHSVGDSGADSPAFTLSVYYSQTFLWASSLVLQAYSSGQNHCFLWAAHWLCQLCYPKHLSRRFPCLWGTFLMPCSLGRCDLRLWSPVWSFSRVHPMLLQNPGYSVLCLGCLVLFPDPSLFLTLQELPRLSLPKRRSSRKHSPVLTLQSWEFFLDSFVLVSNTVSLLVPAGSPISLSSLSTLTLPLCLLPSAFPHHGFC